MSHDDMGELELLEFFKQGSCFKKFNHARLAADRYHSCRLWIAADELRCASPPEVPPFGTFPEAPLWHIPC